MAAIDSYVESDAAKAAAIDDMDTLLDDLQREFIQVIFESHAAGRIDLQVAVQLAVVARFYERIGDHAVNIGERVRYMVTGWLPEHDGAARYRARRASRSPTSRGRRGRGLARMAWPVVALVVGLAVGATAVHLWWRRRAAADDASGRERAATRRGSTVAALERALAELRAALDALPEGVVLVDARGRDWWSGTARPSTSSA